MEGVGYLTPNDNYFYTAFLYVIEKTRVNSNSSYVFVACTDEPKWVQENFVTQKLVQFAKTRKYSEQLIELVEKNVHFEVIENIPARDKALCLLTLMDHMIMSVGTFGWWAAFLNENNFKYTCSRNENNTVVCIAPKKPILTYFNKPFREGSAVSYYFNVQDHYPPHWIGFGNN